MSGVTDETMYAAALQSLPGLGSRRLKTILDRYRSAKDAWNTPWDDDLRRRLRLSTTSFGKLIEERNVFDWDGFSRKLSFYGVRPIALWDDDYPCWLPFIAQPPWVLFLSGDAGSRPLYPGHGRFAKGQPLRTECCRNLGYELG